MKTHLLALALLATPLACGPSSPEAQDPSAGAPTATATAAPATTATAAATATATAAATAAAKAPEMTADEKKKAEDARQLAEDRAKLDAAHQAEQKRLTPEIRAEAKALAETKHATLDAALGAALKSKHRKPQSLERDRYRHPLETLKLFGMKPTMTVVEYGPGEGWYTELLAPVLAAKGKLHITTPDPNGPRETRSTFYAERTKRTIELFPEIYSKVEPIVIDPKNPQLGLDGKADMVLAIRALHNLHRDKLLSGFLATVHKALKPNGVLGVVQHRANADANPDESAKKGYLPEAFVIKEAEAAGFKLAEKSEVNANPKDTKDHAEGVWTLPPTYRLGDNDRDKYAAIGESDRMTLRFVKTAKK
jgi:predicted methyltransferase